VPTTGAAAPATNETAVRLRISVARLARLLRQQDQSGFGPTLTAALATVAAHGPIALGELAAYEQVAPPTISKVVDKLEVHGLVERVADPSDKRVRRVAITDAGRDHLEGARTRRDAWLLQRLSTLSADELARLDTALDVLEKLTLAPERGEAAR